MNISPLDTIPYIENRNCKCVNKLRREIAASDDIRGRRSGPLGMFVTLDVDVLSIRQCSAHQLLDFLIA